MTYRSLLLLLDQSPLCAARTEAAIRLSQDLNAHLVGLAPTGLVEVPSAMLVAAGVRGVASDVAKNLRAQAERAAELFGQQCSAAGIKSFQTVVDEADAAKSVVQHAQSSDLTVLSQVDPGGENIAQARDLVEQVVLYSARPTLMVPYVGHWDAVGTRAMVAWDGSSEAARAVSDALPLLRLAKQVQVIQWIERETVHEETLQARLDALKQWLTHHGVKAETRLAPHPGIGIADAILSRAADFGADLIVMGAYGRGRLSERILGGATRGLLASMTAPVLMSH
ncbi:MAG: universal stress protein [Burkholderiales bacterium]